MIKKLWYFFYALGYFGASGKRDDFRANNTLHSYSFWFLIPIVSGVSGLISRLSGVGPNLSLTVGLICILIPNFFFCAKIINSGTARIYTESRFLFLKKLAANRYLYNGFHVFLLVVYQVGFYILLNYLFN